jgi:hypothetical protein
MAWTSMAKLTFHLKKKIKVSGEQHDLWSIIFPIDISGLQGRIR